MALSNRTVNLMISSPPTSNSEIRRASRNTLGVGGFVVSVIGILTCGLLAPVGLLLSLLGLLKRPRGLAAAGTVMGLLGTFWLGLIGSLLVCGVKRLEPLAERLTGEFLQAQATLTVVAQAAQDVDVYRNEQGDWPVEKIGQELVGRYQDAYGTALRYTRVGEMVLILSAGADREFATPDDVALDPQAMSGQAYGGQLQLDID
jgi:hypothetical protein